jgi:hypothetical protein
MGFCLIFSTKTDTQLTELCFLQVGLLLPLWDFEQSCMHKPCWVYVASGQHLLAKTTPNAVIKLPQSELNPGCLHHVSPCYQLCYYEQLNSTSVYKTQSNNEKYGKSAVNKQWHVNYHFGQGPLPHLKT